MKKYLVHFSIIALILTTFACSTYRPISATSNPLGSKTGEASRLYIFGIIPAGEENTISNAAKNGRISKISTVDFKHTWYVFAIQHKTIVTGE